ncbi:helix-turn-helix domain-containing protein [Anaerostipes caccae]
MEIRTWHARHDKNLSLKQLQDLTGISKTTLNDIENGKQSPTLDQLEIIAIALNVRITDLFISKYK